MAKVKTMLRNVFLKTLRDQRMSLLFWAIGVAALSLLTVLFYPSVKDIPELSELFDESDAIARVFAGGFTDLNSAEGYLNSQLYSLLVPILFLIFTIAQGTGATAAEEERGTLDILLSSPLTRVQVLVHKLGAMVAAVLALAVVLWVSVIIGAVIVDMELGLAGTTAVTVHAVLLAMSFGGLALATGSATGKRGLSTGVTGAVAVTAYFIYALIPLVDGLEHASKVSPFHYYITADPLVNGLNFAHAGMLLAMTAVSVIVALVTFERRDLAV